MSRKTILLILIVALGAALRLMTITWGLPNRYHTVTYFSDENSALVQLQGMNPSRLDFNPATGPDSTVLSGTFHLYAYAATLKLLSLTKWLTIVNDESFYREHPGEWVKFFLTGRLLSVLAGVLTILALYFVGARLYSPAAGLLAALTLALMPAHIVFSQYLVMNVPGLLWIVLSFLYLYRMAVEGRMKDYLLAGAVIGIAVSTRYSAAPLAVLFVWTALIGQRREGMFKKLAAGGAMIAACFVLGTPYSVLDYPSFIASLRVTNTVSSGSAALGIGAGALFVLKSFIEGMGWFPFAIATAGILWALRKRTTADRIVLPWVALMVFLFIRAADLALPGRILPALPFVALLGARFVDDLAGRRTWMKYLFAALLAVFSLQFLVPFLVIRAKPDVRDVASAWIEENVPSGATIGLPGEPSADEAPGIIDRTYRHPGENGLPRYSFVMLGCGGDPGYIVVSVLDSIPLPKEQRDRLDAMLGRYILVKRFDTAVAVFGSPVDDRFPALIWSPTVSIYKKK